MSELNDLIHTNAHNAFGIGVRTEQERIIKLLESNNKLCTEKTVCIEANEGYPCNCTELIALIKGEKK
jgi:hypothetical protein